MGVDYVALSFVQRPEDLHQIKQFMRARQAEIPVIAKFERPQAVDAMEKILPLCDAVMVARGDLGVELAPEKVPLIQKELVSKANDHDLPVIVATQMLESMINNPRPTRAETSDVANAILDGTDAVMLSGETAVGSYPFEAVAVMSRIICEVETRGRETPVARIAQRIENEGLGWIRDESARNCKAVCHSARSIANDADIKAICAITKSGFTGNLISHFRPKIPIYAYSHRPEVRRRLALCWGVTPRPIEWKDTVKGMFGDIERDLLEHAGLKEGDSVVLLFGFPIEKSGTTNAVMIQTLSKGGGA
jgi:pyruvate kinase